MDGSAHISGVFSQHLLSLIDVNTAMGQAASQNQSMPHREYFNMVPGWQPAKKTGGFPELFQQFAKKFKCKK